MRVFKYLGCLPPQCVLFNTSDTLSSSFLAFSLFFPPLSSRRWRNSDPFSSFPLPEEQAILLLAFFSFVQP